MSGAYLEICKKHALAYSGKRLKIYIAPTYGHDVNRVPTPRVIQKPTTLLHYINDVSENKRKHDCLLI